ncbi:MAG: HEAT repeat domain-containing protein [Candidatus Micrarchaeia archaeon]
MAWFKRKEERKVIKGFVPDPKPAKAPQIPAAPKPLTDGFDDDADLGVDNVAAPGRYNNYNYGYGYGYTNYGTGTGAWWQSAEGIAWDLKNGYTKAAKIEAAEKLARLNTDEALDKLIDAVDVADKDVREAVFSAIAKIGTAKAVGKLIKNAVGNVKESEKVERLVDALKDEKNNKKELILIALKLDSELKAAVAAGADADLAKGLWDAGEAAFPLIAEIAKDGSKRKLLETALAAAPADTISAALTADEDMIVDMAVSSISDKGDYRFLPELIDAAVKTANSVNVQKAIITIEKKMGMKGFSLPKVSDFSEAATSGPGSKNSRVLFITESREVGEALIRGANFLADTEADTVDYSGDIEKLKKKALKYRTVFVQDTAHGDGARLAYWLAQNGASVIFSGFRDEVKRFKEKYGDCKCRCMDFVLDLKKLIKIILDDKKKAEEAEERGIEDGK